MLTISVTTFSTPFHFRSKQNETAITLYLSLIYRSFHKLSVRNSKNFEKETRSIYKHIGETLSIAALKMCARARGSVFASQADGHTLHKQQ